LLKPLCLSGMSLETVLRPLTRSATPVSGGLKFWILQEGNYAAFAMHKWIATNVLVPALPVLDPIVFPAELLRAASFMLGFFVRPMAVIGILYTLQLWLGLYQNPSERPWEYMFLIFTMGFFYVCRAGMSLGSTHGSPVSHLGHSGTTGSLATLYRRLARQFRDRQGLVERRRIGRQGAPRP
jgi:uncharacterized membrane protein YphA (DoxX/SURF4 family)